MSNAAPRPPCRLLSSRAGPAVLWLLAAGCGSSTDRVTSPASPQAAEIDGLWTLILWMGTAVWVVVMALLAVPIVRSWRRGTDASRDAEPPGPTTDIHSRGIDDGRSHDRAPPASVLDEPLVAARARDSSAAQADRHVRARLLWIGGIVGPVLILLVLLIVSGRVGASTAHVERDDELVIEVTGHMFWWEVHYPEYDVTTANEVHVPVDRPVRLRLATEDVIHSFWVPRIHGKIDMVPGKTNSLSFEPTQTGRFRGACAEFCGIAHAQMLIWLVAESSQDFDAWLDDQRAGAASPASTSAREGERIFTEAGCASCHTVRGTNATGGVGPDLTHLASRERLAAGIVTNDREHLEELILSPSSIKPGIAMPPSLLDPDELDALVEYLEGLR